jgi:hypothetical protein
VLGIAFLNWTNIHAIISLKAKLVGEVIQLSIACFQAVNRVLLLSLDM